MVTMELEIRVYRCRVQGTIPHCPEETEETHTKFDQDNIV
jgi:hypothetical protein